MASCIDDLRRNMLPLWRSYEDTARARELDFTSRVALPVRFERYSMFRDAWRAKHTIMTAADLINAAVVSGNQQQLDVLAAAEYLLQHKEESSPIALDVARSIVEFDRPTLPNSVAKEPSFEDLAKELIAGLKTQEDDIKARIGLLRKQVHEHCNNPIVYCELARCYANLGLDEKAKQYMNYAVFLAPNSRYISRSAARFFVHIGDFDRARRILIANGRVNSDPWVMAAEIAVETVMERSSRYLKIGRQLVLSGNVSAFSSSELCFAICNEDKISGKRKDARKMYEKGIIDPNDNSLAQAEFFAKEDLNINLDLTTYKSLAHKNEADTRKALSLGNYEAAFISSMKWMQDYRFEHRPIEFAFGISCDYLKKYDYAIEIVRAFIKSNPKDPAAVNNLVYALGLSDKVEEAERELLKIDIKKYSSGNTNNSICLLATCGLIEYRKGEIETGRELYNSSIAAAKKSRDKEKGKKLYAKARLNMIREEIRAVDDYDEKLLNELDDLNTGSKVETEQLKKDILDEVKKKAEKKGRNKQDS